VTIAGVALRVTVIDDDAAYRVLLRRICAAAGIEVVGEAASAAEGLAVTSAHRPDGVLLDVHLPDATGPAVARGLTAAASPPGILLMSSEPEGWDDEAARAAGASGFLAKTAIASADLVGWFEQRRYGSPPCRPLVS
jgi:two-component system nitrate/nitrite response regulator NarL